MELKELYLKEYDKLQSEIANIMTEIASVEKYAVTTSGGIFAWLFTHEECLHGKAEIAFLLPALLTLLFGIITYGLFLRAKMIAGFIRDRYESRMTEEQDPKRKFGWETYLKQPSRQGSWLFYGRLAFWAILLVANVAIWANLQF